MELPITNPGLTDDDPDNAHISCCDDDLSLCGADLPGWVWCDDDWPDEDICEVCVRLDRTGRGCGARFCRARQWWRDRSWWWSR